MELWKDVVDYEGLYEVSNYGRVKNKKRDRLLSPHSDRAGYIKVGLYKDGKQKGQFVHRLVAMAFIDNPEEKSDVNHIDGDKSNNHVENLEWNTRSENLTHAYENRLLIPLEGEDNGNAKLSEEQVIAIKETVESGVSQSQIARILGVSQPTISYIVNGINWKSLA